MKVLLKRFHLNGNTIGFRPQTQKFIKLHPKWILPRESTAEEFYLEGNTIGFHPKIHKLELRTKHLVPCRESTAESKGFHLNGNTIGFCPQTQSSKRHS